MSGLCIDQRGLSPDTVVDLTYLDKYRVYCKACGFILRTTLAGYEICACGRTDCTIVKDWRFPRRTLNKARTAGTLRVRANNPTQTLWAYVLEWLRDPKTVKSGAISKGENHARRTRLPRITDIARRAGQY